MTQPPLSLTRSCFSPITKEAKFTHAPSRGLGPAAASSPPPGPWRRRIKGSGERCWIAVLVSGCASKLSIDVAYIKSLPNVFQLRAERAYHLGTSRAPAAYQRTIARRFKCLFWYPSSLWLTWCCSPCAAVRFGLSNQASDKTSRPMNLVFMFEGIRQYLIEDFDLIRRHLNQLESERVRSSSALAVVDELGKSELRNSISRLWISAKLYPSGQDAEALGVRLRHCAGQGQRCSTASQTSALPSDPPQSESPRPPILRRGPDKD
jgi:hypothetical protein